MIEKIRKPEKTRNFATYIVSLLIFGMIVSTFVFMIPGMTGPTGVVNTAAEVGKNTVSLREYNDQLRMVRLQYQRMFNGEIPPFLEANLKGQVLESLVQSEVMGQFAKEQGVMISDTEVADFLKKEISAFQEEGQFSLLRYNAYLKSVRLSPSKFEKRVYRDILRRKMQNAFDLAFTKTDLEQTYAQESKDLKVKFQYIKYDLDLIKNSIKVSATEASNFISLPDGLKKVESYFNSNKKDYTTPKQVRFSYILFEDKKRADEVQKELSPENFAKKAKTESKDPLSQAKGGDVGFIKKGDFDKDIENLVFSMARGEISKPIKTSKGFAITYVTDIKDSKALDFAKNKKTIAKDFLEKQGLKSVKDKIKALEEKGDSKALLEFLINSGHKWSKVIDFALTATSLPEFGKVKEVYSKLVSLAPNAIGSKLFLIGSERYLLKNRGFVKSNKTKSKNDIVKARPNNTTRGQEAYFLVYQSEKKKRSIVINDQLLTR